MCSQATANHSISCPTGYGLNVVVLGACLDMSQRLQETRDVLFGCVDAEECSNLIDAFI